MDSNIIFGILHKVDNQVKRKLDQIALKHGITGMQAFFLKYINDKSQERDVFQKDIEKIFDIRRSSVSTMLSCMEKKKYIKRESIPDDKRVNKIVLTELGLKTHQEVDSDIKKYKEGLLHNLSEEEVDLFYRLLEKLSENTK